MLSQPETYPFAWMPKDMDADDKEAFTKAHAGDPHAAAAAAWEAYGTQLMVETNGIVSVSTGAQSATMSDRGAAAGALARADWHRARARVRSVRVGPELVEDD